MLVKEWAVTRNDENTKIYAYQVSERKFIDVWCNNDNSIREIHLINDNLHWSDEKFYQRYKMQGLWYLETALNEDKLDTKELINMVKFDEMEVVC